MLRIVLFLLLTSSAFADTLTAIDRDGTQHVLVGVSKQVCFLAVQDAAGTADNALVTDVARSVFRRLKLRSAEEDVTKSPELEAMRMILAGGIKSATCE